MTRKVHFMAAAALALGGISFTGSSALAQNADQQPGQTSSQDQSQARQRQGNGDIVMEHIVIYGVLQPVNAQQIAPGFGHTEMQETPGVRDTLSKVAQAALEKKNGFSDLLKYVEDKDRQRLEKTFSKADNQKLDSAISQFQKAWLNRYDKNFDISAQVASFTHVFTIYAGEITNPTMLSNWPVEQRQGQEQNQGGQQDQAQQGQQNQHQQAQKQQAQNQQQGQQEKEAAVVVFPAQQGLPETYVSLVKQDGIWKIDLPDKVDPQKVRDDLTHAIEHLSTKQTQFPDDQNQGYQHVTHAILMGLYGQQPGQNQQGGQGPGQQQGQSHQNSKQGQGEGTQK